MHTQTHKEQVIEECQRIETLALAIADAASRQFMAPIDEEDFETGKGPDYSMGLRTFRIQIERFTQRTLGIDRSLDEALHEYMMNVLRAHPRDRKPALFQVQ